MQLKSASDGPRCPQIPPRRPESRLSGGRWQRHQHGREQQYRDERGELSLPPALGRTDALPSGGQREGEYQYQRGELRHDEASVRGVREIARSREVLKCQQRAASRRDQERRAADISAPHGNRSEEHTSELQSQSNLVCRLLLEKKKTGNKP